MLFENTLPVASDVISPHPCCSLSIQSSLARTPTYAMILADQLMDPLEGFTVLTDNVHSFIMDGGTLKDLSK